MNNCNLYDLTICNRRYKGEGIAKDVSWNSNFGSHFVLVVSFRESFNILAKTDYRLQ